MSNGDEAAPAPTTRVVALGPELLLRGVVIPSFAQFATTGEDNLRIITSGRTAGFVNVQGRFLDAKQGQTIPFFYRVPVTGDRSLVTMDFPLGTGYLLNLTAIADVGGATFYIGGIFAIVQIIRGIGGATYLLGTLMAGYLSTVVGLGWPGTPIVNSTAVEPNIRFLAGATPAPGGEISEAVPTMARWELISFSANLTTSAAGGTRIPNLQYVSGGIVYGTFPATAGVPPSTAITLTWGIGIGPLTPYANAPGLSALPNGPSLPFLALIRSVTNGIQAGDQWSIVNYQIREWLEI